MTPAIAAASVPPFFILPALFVSFPFWVWALDGAERRSGLGRLFGPAFRITSTDSCVASTPSMRAARS